MSQALHPDHLYPIEGCHFHVYAYVHVDFHQLGKLDLVLPTPVGQFYLNLDELAMLTFRHVVLLLYQPQSDKPPVLVIFNIYERVWGVLYPWLTQSLAELCFCFSTLMLRVVAFIFVACRFGRHVLIGSLVTLRLIVDFNLGEMRELFLEVL